MSNVIPFPAVSRIVAVADELDRIYWQLDAGKKIDRGVYHALEQELSTLQPRDKRDEAILSRISDRWILDATRGDTSCLELCVPIYQRRA